MAFAVASMTGATSRLTNAAEAYSWSLYKVLLRDERYTL